MGGGNVWWSLLLAFLIAGSGCVQPSPSTTSVPVEGGVALRCIEPCLHVIDAGGRWEPAVAVDPRDPNHIVASSQDLDTDPSTTLPGYWPLAHVSFDGGATWTTSRIPGGPSAPPGHPLARYDAMGDSVPLILPDGTVLWSAIADDRLGVVPRIGQTTGDALVVLRSADGGRAFPEAQVVEDGSGTYGTVTADKASTDKQWFAVDEAGHVLMVWSRNRETTPDCPTVGSECSAIRFSVSTDSGRTWSAPADVEQGVFSGAFPLMLHDGTWIVSYRDTSRREVRLATSSDEGRTWHARSLGDPTTKFPVLAAGPGPTGQRVFVAFPRSNASDVDGDQEVTMRWSDDSGRTWSAALGLDEPVKAGSTIPALSVAGADPVVTFWHRLEKGGSELRAVVVHDGKAERFVVLDTTDGSASDLGDYMGLAPRPHGVFAVWNAHHGQRDVVTGATLALA